MPDFVNLAIHAIYGCIRPQKILFSLCFLALSGALQAEEAGPGQNRAQIDGQLVGQQQSDVDSVVRPSAHWAMGAFFGTGWYELDDNRSVFIFRIPPRQTLRTSSLDAQGGRRFGVELQYPLSVGLHRLDGGPEIIDFDNLGTVSFTPGVQLEIPVSPKWYLRPHFNAGYGYEFESGDSAWIYSGGVRSRYALGGKSLNWSLLNAVYWAGYSETRGGSGEFASLMTGLEFSQPLASLELGGDPLQLNWHLTYTWMFDELDFGLPVPRGDDRFFNRFDSVDDQWELGLALAKQGKKLDLGFMAFEQVGLSLKWSTDGRFRAISVNVRSPFSL